MDLRHYIKAPALFTEGRGFFFPLTFAQDFTIASSQLNARIGAGLSFSIADCRFLNGRKKKQN